MGEGEVLKQLGKGSESRPLLQGIKTPISPKKQHLSGLDLRSLDRSVRLTERQLRRSHNSGVIKGVIITTATIAAGAALFWLGMNRSEGIIKKLNAQLQTRERRISALMIELDAEKKKAWNLLSEIARKNRKRVEAQKKNQWTIFYNSERELDNAISNALKQYPQEIQQETLQGMTDRES